MSKVIRLTSKTGLVKEVSFGANYLAPSFPVVGIRA